MAIRLGQNGEMALVLRVQDDGSVVVEKFAETADKSAKKSSKAFDEFSSGAGINFKSIATYSGIAAAAVVAGGIAMVAQQINLADATKKAAERIGTTTEALSALAYAGDLAGISQQELEQRMLAMTRQISDAARGLGEAGYAIKDLGLDVSKLARMKPEQAIEAIAAQLDKVPNSYDKARIAADIFQDRSGKMLNVLRGGPAALREMYEEAERAGKIIGTDAAEAAEQFNDNVTRLKANLAGMANTIATAVVPGLLRMTDAMTGQASLATLMLQQARLTQRLQDAYSEQAASMFSPHIDEDIGALETELERVNGLIEKQRKRIEENRTVAGGGTGTGPNSRLDEETQKQVLESQAKVAEEIAKEREQRLVGLQDRLLDLQNSFLAEDEAELVHYEQGLALLYEAWNTRIQVDEFGNTERLLSDAEFKKQREQLELQHQAKLGNIEAQGQLQRQVFERQTLRQKTQTVLGELLLITQGVAQHNRFLFEINKVAAIADAIISAHEGAARTLAKYPWPLGAALAALHYAAGIARVSAIQSTSFGAPSAPSVSAGAAIPVEPIMNQNYSSEPNRLSASAEPVQARRTVNVTLIGQSFSYQQIVDELIPLINEASGNGADIRVAAA